MYDYGIFKYKSSFTLLTAADNQNS